MYCIGFDIGGTKCAVSVGKVSRGNIKVLGREEVPTGESAQETLERLALSVERFRDQYSVKRAGISCGGPLDSNTGVIGNPPNLKSGWYNFPIVEYVKTRFGLQAKLENDANACAVAEWKLGAGRGATNMIFLTFGTGLGAGLILDGKLYSGTNGNAGEVGHMRLSQNGPVGYGKVGSFEGFCSGGGIARLAKKMGEKLKPPPAFVVQLGGWEFVTTKALSVAAFAGDPFAKKVFAKSGKMLGKGLSVVIDFFNPERIVLGGVFMRSHQLLVPAMEKEIKKKRFYVAHQSAKLFRRN